MLNKTEQLIRKTGIDVLGDVSWGSHFCLFYETEEDLTDILVPYFKAGLENNEFCVWVTSGSLSVEEAEEALRKSVPDFDRYLRKEQIRIVSDLEWYLKNNVFDMQRVLIAWADQLNQALSSGFAGMRVAGNMSGFGKEVWGELADYEKEVNNAIGKYRMLAICGYCIDECGTSEIVDVVSCHQSAIIRREGKWEVIESGERKKAEEEIKNLARFPEENSNPVYKTSKDGVLLYANSASRRLIFKDQTKTGDKIPEKWIGMIKNVYDSGKKQQAEMEISGRVFLFDMVPVIEGGYVNSYATDITERKQAEEAMKKTHQLLKDTGEMAKVGGWEFDLSTNKVSWTEEVGRIHGVEPGYRPKLEEALNFYAPEFRPAVEAAVKKAAETGEPYDIEALFIPRGSKNKIWVRSLGKAVYSGDKIVKLAGTFQDIDKYKRAEVSLWTSESKYRTLLVDLPEKIFFKNTNSVYISCSENYARDLKIKVEEIAGKTDYDIYPRELAEKYRDDDRRIIKSGKTEDTNEKYIQNGRELIVHTIKAPVRDKEGNVTGILGISWDITAQRQAQKKLLTYQKQLRELASEVSLTEERQCKHIAGELHDNVTQNLMLFKISLGQLRMTDLPAELIKPLKEINERLDRTIDEMRTLTFDLGSLTLYELGIEAAVRELLSEKVQKHGIKTEFVNDAQPKPLDNDVSAILYRAVRELLINIIKHAKARNVKVSIYKEKNKIRINVIDDGVGFIYPIKKLASNKAGGFGLFSIRERLNYLGGSLEIDSKPGHGTRGTLVMPTKHKETH